MTDPSLGPDSPIIGIVGAGTMGAGIAQIALEHGHEAVLYDVDEEAIARGRLRVREGLARRAAKLWSDEATFVDRAQRQRVLDDQVAHARLAHGQ